MDRSNRITTFASYPDPPKLDGGGTAAPNFSTDLHPVQGHPVSRTHVTTRFGRATRKATGLTLRVIESLIHSTIRVEGAHNVTKGPVLFVANHFTRFETFVLPYIIRNNTGRHVHSLAFAELFRGRFGDFLMSIGAFPTGDPHVKHTMAEDLMTGRHDWLIYPEGSMIKNKKTWSRGRLEIDSPDRSGQAHTGAAILALKAMMYKQLYRQACAKGDAELVERYEKRYHLNGLKDVEVPDLKIIPVNITYFPIRPGKNLVYRMARWLFRQMPTFLEEELAIEGSLLLSETDISVYFGKPVKLDQYLNLLMPTLQMPLPFVEQLRQANHTMGALKSRLTRRIMHEIYTHLTINFDHLFASGLRTGGRERIACEDFHNALYLAARQIQATGHRRSHPSIADALVDLVAGDPYPPLDSISTLAKEEGLIETVDGEYRINHVAFKQEHSFHDIRLKNVLAVIANELEPLRKAIHLIKNAVNLPRTILRREIAQLLHQEALTEFDAERRPHVSSPTLKEAEVGKPFFLHVPGCEIGIVLSHGYLASPGEIRPLAEHLHHLGFSVYGVRLSGHGTDPKQLDTATCEQWVRSYNRAYAAVKNSCRHVILGGFSAGALLALLTASKHADVLGLFAINPSFKLMDAKSRLVPAVTHWNHLLDALHIKLGKYDRVANRAEYPDTNYPVNYLNGLYQLERLRHLTRASLGSVGAPTLIIQGDHDPVVNPTSGDLAYRSIPAEEKELAMMAFDRHVIVHGEGSEPVLERVAEFVQKLAERVRGRHIGGDPGDQPTGTLP